MALLIRFGRNPILQTCGGCGVRFLTNEVGDLHVCPQCEEEYWAYIDAKMENDPEYLAWVRETEGESAS